MKKIDIKFWSQIALAFITCCLSPFLTKKIVTDFVGYIPFIIIIVGVAVWVICLVLIKINKSNYEKIIETMSPELRPYAQKRLAEFKFFMNGFNDQRTGQLPKSDYYAILNKNIKQTIQGDIIWACSSCLENEWDENDDDERTLMHNFKAADNRRVETNRIFILKKDELKPHMNDTATYTSLKNLLPYLKGSEYPNSKSFAIGKADYDKLTILQKNLLGKGFCAFDYNFTKNTFFIYDTPSDTVSNEVLGFGEILFDKKRIQEIKELFNMLIQGKTLKEFVFDKIGENKYVNINDVAIRFLNENGIVDSITIK